jgi:hypothetical protein
VGGEVVQATALPRRSLLSATPASPQASRRIGRALTSEKIDAICRHMQVGIPLSTACGMVGVNRATLYARMASDPDTKDKVMHARDSGVSVLVSEVIEAGKKDWRANQWLLSVLNREVYGRNEQTVKHEHSDVRTKPPADLAAEAVELAAQLAAATPETEN